MNTFKVYIAHALSEASPSFRTRMFELRNAVNAIPHARVLPFAWDPLTGPVPKEFNVHKYDIQQVTEADLMIMICEHASSGMGGEFEIRVSLRTPLLCFTPRGKRVSRFLFDGIREVRTSFCDQHDPIGALEWPDPFAYDTDEDISTIISRWVGDHLTAYHHLSLVGQCVMA
jgi:hypothetical protein